jgi:hypothetical protein
MNKEQLANKIIHCTSQEMQDRVARRLEEMGAKPYYAYIKNDFERFPDVIIKKIKSDVVFWDDKIHNYILSEIGITEITEADLNIRDPRLWVDVREELPPVDDALERYKLSIYVTAKDNLGNEYNEAFYEFVNKDWISEKGEILGNVTHWKTKSR